MKLTIDLCRFAAVLTITGVLFLASLAFPAPWSFVALALALSAGVAGAAALVQPPLWEWPIATAIPYIALPSLMLCAAGLSLQTFAVETLLLAFPAALIATAIFGALVIGKNLVITQNDQYSGTVGEMLNIATYLTAFLLFLLVYRLTLPLLANLVVVAVIGALLTLEMLIHVPMPNRRRWVLSVVVGGTLAETAWSLAQWPQQSWYTAMFLLLGFYLISGLLQSHFRHRLTSCLVLEYVGVGAVSFTFLFALQAWRLG